MFHLNLFRLLDKIPSLQKIPRVDEWVERHHQKLLGQIQVVEAKRREHRCSVLCFCFCFSLFRVFGKEHMENLLCYFTPSRIDVILNRK